MKHIALVIGSLLLVQGCGDSPSPGAGEDEPVVTTAEPPSVPELRQPRPIDYACTLEGHLHLNGRPAQGWQFSMSGVVDEDAGETFEWSSSRPRPVQWVANRLAGGHSRVKFARDLVLVPGRNSLAFDVPVGILELEGFPLPDDFDIAGIPDVTIDIILTWEDKQGLRWSATLLTAEDGSLVLEDVPAGRVAVRRLLPGDPAKTLAEARVAFEIDVAAGQRTLVQFPD